MNDWVDVNIFFTIGKGMVHGLVPYKDLFDQKGPLLFLIYGIGSLISNSTYYGIFLLEVISFTIFLYYAIKIIKLLKADKYIYVIIPILATLLCTSYSFAHGGSAEEFCFPYFSITLYYTLKFIGTKKVSPMELFINGFLAGLVFMIKYTLLGLWFGYMLIIILELLTHRKIKEIFLASIIFLLGMSIPFSLFLLYFKINNGLKEFIDTYFIINLFAYNPNSNSIIDKISLCFTGMLRSLIDNGFIIFMVWMSLFLPLVNNNDNKKDKIYFLIVLISSIIFTYIGGKFYRYYLLILLPFMLFSLIYFFKESKLTFRCRHLAFIYVILLILNINGANYKENIFRPKESYAQFLFADIINEYDNPTILNYRTLDTGLYFTTHTLPNIKYFHQVNISKETFPDSFDSQNRYIKNKEVMFVVVKTAKDEAYIRKHYKNLYKDYKLVSKCVQLSDDKLKTYYLFQLKSL